MKLSEKVLRGIIAEEIKRMSEGPFAGGNAAHLIMTDPRIHDGIAELIGVVVEVAEDRGLWDQGRYELADLVHESLWNDIAEGIEDIVGQIVEMPKDEPYEEDEMLRQSKLPDQAWAEDPNNPKREGQQYSMRKALSEIEEMHMDEEDVELPPMHPRAGRPDTTSPHAAERSPEDVLGKPTTAPRKDRFGGGMGGGYGKGDDGPVDLPPMHPKMVRR